MENAAATHGWLPKENRQIASSIISHLKMKRHILLQLKKERRESFIKRMASVLRIFLLNLFCCRKLELNRCKTPALRR
jgi:hypothetical protein